MTQIPQEEAEQSPASPETVEHCRPSRRSLGEGGWARREGIRFRVSDMGRKLAWRVNYLDSRPAVLWLHQSTTDFADYAGRNGIRP